MGSKGGLVARWQGWAPELRSVLRIVAAFLFVTYGSTKLLGLPAPIMPDGGTAPLTSLAGVAGLLELVGGALLLVGLFVRPVAFVLAGEMAVAYFYGHAPSGNWLWPVLNRGDSAAGIPYCAAGGSSTSS